MFESVLLPAPFSPSSACTSPTAASKSTPSLATTPGNRFVIPRIATASLVAGTAVATAFSRRGQHSVRGREPTARQRAASPSGCPRCP